MRGPRLAMHTDRPKVDDPGQLKRKRTIFVAVKIITQSDLLKVEALERS